MTTITWNNGEADDTCDTIEEAREAISRRYPDAVFGEGDPSRILVWRDEESAGESGLGDDGSKAIAEIVADR